MCGPVSRIRSRADLILKQPQNCLGWGGGGSKNQQTSTNHQHSINKPSNKHQQPSKQLQTPCSNTPGPGGSADLVVPLRGNIDVHCVDILVWCNSVTFLTWEHCHSLRTAYMFCHLVAPLRGSIAFNWEPMLLIIYSFLLMGTFRVITETFGL